MSHHFINVFPYNQGIAALLGTCTCTVCGTHVLHLVCSAASCIAYNSGQGHLLTLGRRHGQRSHGQNSHHRHRFEYLFEIQVTLPLGWGILLSLHPIGERCHGQLADEEKGGTSICFSSAFSRPSMAASLSLISVSPSHSGWCPAITTASIGALTPLTYCAAFEIR
jgi:hypothetical protein